MRACEKTIHECTPQQSRNMIVLALENGITDKDHQKKLLHYAQVCS